VDNRFHAVVREVFYGVVDYHKWQVKGSLIGRRSATPERDCASKISISSS